MLKSFEDNASAREIVTTTDDNGMVQFVLNTILQADGSRLSDVPTDRLLALLPDACENVVPREGTSEDLGLVTALLAANEGSGDTTFKDLRKRRTIVGRAFEFLVANTTTSGIPRSGMRPATIGDSTYPLLPSRLQMTQPVASLSTHSLSTTLYILPSATTPPPNTPILGTNGRGSETSLETTDDTGEDRGAAYSHVLGLRTDFDIPRQVSHFRGRTIDTETAQSLYTDGRAYRACGRLQHVRNSAIIITFLKHAITYQVRT